jgi:Nucleotide modification associated domain 3
MNGLLVRVGIDSTDGCWNAPVNGRTREFVYVTITEAKPVRPGLVRFYDEFIPALSKFGTELPQHLRNLRTHLDPDFSTLTYGDQGRRAQQITKLAAGDILVFFASFREVSSRMLVYAIIGLYVIDEILSAQMIERKRWSENAHTRRLPGQTDIVVRARPKISGRLEKCIPIGEYRDRAYRVTKTLLNEWGDLTVRDGYLQRSARLPTFCNASRFYHWFRDERGLLLKRNN